MLLIKNCKIILENSIEPGSLLVDQGKIVEINPCLSDFSGEVIDGEGLYLSPGFIDIHIHGAGGCDTMDGTFEALNTIAKTIANHGTTSFLPTTMTCNKEDIKKSLGVIKDAKKSGTDGANVLGAHLEGPFINPEMIGAQNPNFIQSPSIENFNNIVGDNIDAVTSITLAPEVDGAHDLIRYLSTGGIRVSMGHTKATYDEAMEGIQCGVCHCTHLYNAMTPLHHREPGVVGATFDSHITTETISDGIHISFPSLRVAYSQKGTEKVMLITDAMMACSMVDGQYSLGGQDVFVKNGAARLKNGALAGSILTLDKAIHNVFTNTNYPLWQVVKMATLNPAKFCNVSHKKGLIKKGYDADLVLFDENINIKKVIINGNVVK